MSSVAVLPSDIFLLICEELGVQRAFETLFNCALASKQLVRPALRSLYRIPNIALSTSESNEVDISRINSWKDASVAQDQKRHRRYIRHWAMQWRSIILSSLGKTAFPYSLYIRSLDLQDLEQLLEEDTFRDHIQAEFFAGEMADFYRSLNLPAASKTRLQRLRFDIPDILNKVGETVTKYAGESVDHNGPSATLEDISGKVRAGVLPQWIQRISRLRSLTLWDGSILNASVAEAIRDHCPLFESLTMYLCRDGGGRTADSDMAGFVSGLPSNTLRSFSIIRWHDVGPETFLALGRHGKSLKELKIDCLGERAVTSLHLLADCTALEVVTLQDAQYRINLEETQNDVFEGVVSWLRHCSQLKEIKLTDFLSGPAILKHVCLEDTIKLKSLGLVKYTLTNNKDFHRALSTQTSLEKLELRGDPEEPNADDIETLTSAISNLGGLTYLNLQGISDLFSSADICVLARKLLQLEELTIGGYDVRDEIWPSISGLLYLRSLCFHALTYFSFESLLHYINTLQPTNARLLLSVMSASTESSLAEDEQAILTKTIEEKVDGRFEFVLFREIESDFDELSD